MEIANNSGNKLNLSYLNEIPHIAAIMDGIASVAA
jgi:hypothetical protein